MLRSVVSSRRAANSIARLPFSLLYLKKNRGGVQKALLTSNSRIVLQNLDKKYRLINPLCNSYIILQPFGCFNYEL